MTGKCPHCGAIVGVQDGLTLRHFYQDALCPGSAQTPRDPESDRRPLWKDNPTDEELNPW